jgi:chromosome transmission fidelity protein 4
VLKLFAEIVQTGKVDRALDLVDRLRLEKSYELAIKLSAGHHKLANLIEDAKEDKFGRAFADSPEYFTREEDDVIESQRRITPDARPVKRAIVNDSTQGARQVRNRQVY